MANFRLNLRFNMIVGLLLLCVHNLCSHAIQQQPVNLTILPVGDSITDGVGSSDGNGYRLKLKDDLEPTNVTYIGNVTSGSMPNNNHEGHSGKTISEIADLVKNVSCTNTNLVLLHAGTNDIARDPPAEPYDSAPARLGALIDQLAASCADASLLVAQIVSNSNASSNARIATFNIGVAQQVMQRAADGRKILLVDMQVVTPDYLADGLHPNDRGYQLMADQWKNATLVAQERGWIPSSTFYSAHDTARAAGKIWNSKSKSKGGWSS